MGYVTKLKEGRNREANMDRVVSFSLIFKKETKKERKKTKKTKLSLNHAPVW